MYIGSGSTIEALTASDIAAPPQPMQSAGDDQSWKWGDIKMKPFLFAPVLGIAAFAASASFAEDCKQYPKGPERFSCMSRQNPGFTDKQERCKQEAAKMGLRDQNGPGGNAMMGYVHACMNR
jgi:hypothetical protein